MNEVFEKIIEQLEEVAYVSEDVNSFVDLEDAIEIVKQEAEQYNNGWILCSEQFPEDGMYVLVQDFDEYYEIGICEKRNGVIGITSGDWWTSANNYIAWQPLPQPYRSKKKTNADRIREMTDEELATFLCKVKADYQWKEEEFPSECECGEWVEWLQSEVEELDE